MTTTTNYFDLNEEREDSVDRRTFQRSCTDLGHLFVFGVFFLLWCGITCFVTIVDYNSLHTKEDHLRIDKRVIHSVTMRDCCAIISFSLLNIPLMGLYFTAIRYYTKYVIYITLFSEFVLMAALFVLVIATDFVGKQWVIAILLICFIFYGLEICMLKKVGVQSICDITQEACKAMKSQPLSVVITFIIDALLVLMIVFVSVIIFYDVLIIQKETHKTKGTLILRCFFTVAFGSYSLWMIRVIHNVGRTTLYGVFSTWYRISDKSTLPRTIPFRITYTILRYHLGTLTFGSTIFTIVPIVRTVYNSWIDLYVKFKTKKITIYCFLFVLNNATSNTFVATWNYSTGYYRSMQRSFKLLMQHPLKFAVIRLGTEIIIIFGINLILLMSIGFTLLYMQLNPDLLLVFIIVEGISIFVNFVFLETLHVATTAILYCFLDSALKNTSNEDDAGIINDI